eukprot:2223122-Pyramimonas_sp.AAC.1
MNFNFELGEDLEGLEARCRVYPPRGPIKYEFLYTVKENKAVVSSRRVRSVRRTTYSAQGGK